MRRHSFVGFASFLTASSLFLAACGDNKPASPANQDAGTGGVMDGGGTGGAAGTGGAGGAGGLVCSASFVSPANGATLNEANGGGVGMCSTDGFQATITVATNQPDGTVASLSVGNGPLVTAKVSGSTVTFSKIILPQQSNLPLKVSFSTTCSTSIMVNVDCSLPACSITAPVLTPVHPALNGVPATAGGDRASASGAAYQVAFKVKTDIEDGKDVRLVVTNNDVSGQQVILTAKAAAGFAPFPGVTLVPDGVYDVRAFCKNAAGAEGSSTSPAPYPVDTTGPDLTISSPSNDAFMGPGMLTNGAFKVCAKTTSADAVGLGAALGAAAKNLCVSVGSSACANPVAVAAVGTDTCVDIACPGSAPFDINVTLTDGAGNPTKKTITNVACTSTLPGVQIISPPSDDSTPAFSDVTKRLLSASSTNTFKDQSAGTLGAQWDVVACTNTAGDATLYGGQKGGTLTAIGASVPTAPAVPADNCPGGYQFVVKFAGATLPESMEDGTGALMTPTELRVDIRDKTTAVGQSPKVNLWVDSIAPTVSVFPSPPLCGTVIQSDTDKTVGVVLSTTTPSVTLTATSSSGQVPYTNAVQVGGFLTFNSVVLKLGTNTLTALASEAAGNSSGLPASCSVTVGTPPVVAFQSPAPGQQLCASSNTTTGCIADADSGSQGWQGTLAVLVTSHGVAATSGTVNFSSGSGSLIGQATIDGTGHASLAGVTLPEGINTVVATTSAFGSDGTGTAVVTPVVDTIPPLAPGGVDTANPTKLQVATLNHRQTSVTVKFVAPSDGSGTVSSYDVRYSTAALDATTFETATKVSAPGSVQGVGAVEARTVGGLVIEKPYYFGVAAVDSVGNRGPAIFSDKFVEHFTAVTLTGSSANTGFGSCADGTGDANGDGKTDILVGNAADTSSNWANLYLGATAFAAGAPSATFMGSQSGFGVAANFIGDINGDGLEDIAIGAPNDNGGNGAVYIYKGRANWSASTPTLPDFTLAADASYAGSFFGYPITRGGDLNGDGVADLVISAANYGSLNGRVVVVFGSKTFETALPIGATSLAGRTLVLDGEHTSTSDTFGAAVVALGAKNGTLVVSAPNATVSGMTIAGKAYAYQIQSGSAVLLASSVGPATNSQMGRLFSVVGAGRGLLVSSYNYKSTIAGVTTRGNVMGYLAAPISNPFSGAVTTIYDSLNASGDRFGIVLAGGGFSGLDAQGSFLGDAAGDVVIAGTKENAAAPQLYIVEGNALASAGATVDVRTSAAVTYPLPADWAGSSTYVSMARDLNGDGYEDVIVGEAGTNRALLGRVIVLY